MITNNYDALLHILHYSIMIHKLYECSRSQCPLCPYFSQNNGFNKDCSELKDSEKLEIFCREAEKIEFEEGEYHDLQQL